MRIVDLRRSSRGRMERGPGSGTLRRLPRALWIAAGTLGLLTLIGYMALAWQLSRPFGDQDASTLLIIGADEPEHGRSRADTMLLARVQLRPTRRVTLLSLPRDSRVRIPGRKGHAKLNAAFAFGGAALERRAVTANFGIPIDHVVVSYSAGLATVVDALGGVDVEVPRAMNYDDNCQNLHIHLKPGLQRLNGAQAVQFVRFRKDGRGDIGRVQRQQAFLKTLAHQALTPALLTRWGRVEPALHSAFQTDLTSQQMLGLAYSLRGLAPEELQTRTLPGRAAMLHRVSYYLPRTEAAASLLGVTPVTRGNNQ